MPPQVSVIIATYNYGRYLAGAVQSVLEQNVEQFELIVVDDGSTDDTAEIIRPFLTDSRIRYVIVAHGGVARARNAGIELAKAPLIAFLDADDEWLPGKLERQMALFTSDPQLGVVCTRRTMMDENGCDLPTPPTELHRGYVLAQMFRDNFICFSSAMVRREALVAVGLFDESLRLASDYDMWLRIASRYRVEFVDMRLVKYRIGHSSLSRRVEERYETAMEIMHRFLDSGGGRRLLSPAMVKRTWAETYTNLGWVRRNRSPIAALPCFLNALRASTGYMPAWKALLTLTMPERCRRWLRKTLKRSDFGHNAISTKSGQATPACLPNVPTHSTTSQPIPPFVHGASRAKALRD